jgi:glucokinase
LRELFLGEIVGNRARLALVRASEDGAFEILDHVRFERGDPKHFEERLGEFLAKQAPGEREAAIAVGGPVEGQHARLTKDSFVISARALARTHNFKRVLLRNDFVALALGAVLSPADSYFSLISGGGDPTSSTVIVGPNAGLGMATIRKIDGRWAAFESEGGHQSFSPADLDEMALWRELLPGSQYVTFEDVISEPGVLTAYRVFTRLSGGTPNLATFQAVVDAARTRSNQAAVQACSVVARSLATFAGNACLAAGARGGVIIAGSVAQALENFMTDASFAQRFQRRGPMTLYVADIPVRLLRDDDAVLRGLAAHVFYSEAA